MPAFVHTLSIERSSESSTDDHGQPVVSFAELAEVPGLIQPKTQREIEAASQAGAAIGSHTIFMGRRDITTQDRIRDVTESPSGPIYQVVGVRDFNFGGLAHLEVDAVKVTSNVLAVGS